jgi:hypothetical protein
MRADTGESSRMRSRGLGKRMAKVEDALSVHETEAMRWNREELTRWLSNADEAKALCLDYQELVKVTGSGQGVLGLQEGRGVILAMVESLYAMDEGLAR